MLCNSFKLVSCNRFEKKNIKKRHGRVGSGRADPGRTGPVLHEHRFYIWKQSFFVLWTISLKSILSEICVVASYHMWLQKEALDCERRSASLNVARNNTIYLFIIPQTVESVLSMKDTCGSRINNASTYDSTIRSVPFHPATLCEILFSKKFV